jgi:hypothetical protein
MERLDEARRLQQDGTAVWLFEEATFVNWRGSDETTEQYSFPSEGSKVLWVKGKIFLHLSIFILLLTMQRKPWLWENGPG